MSEQTHWRDYARTTVERHLGDADHVSGGIRWNTSGTRALMRFRGPPESSRHMTPAEARSHVRTREQWRKGFVL